MSAPLSCSPIASDDGEVPTTRADPARASVRSPLVVRLRLTKAFVPEAKLGPQAARQQRDQIRAKQDAVARRLEASGHARASSLKRYRFTPYVALWTDEAGRRALETDPDVARVFDDRELPPLLAQSIPIIGTDVASASGASGAGSKVVIIDSGVEKEHGFLKHPDGSLKVVAEACFSITNPDDAGNSDVESFCGDVASSTAAGSAAPCPLEDKSCDHGTHVAGIAAGNGAYTAQTFNGVARDADLIAIQVFHQENSRRSCILAGGPPCISAYTSDILAALEHVKELAETDPTIVSVNMSLGRDIDATEPCAGEPGEEIVDELTALGIAVVAATGNVEENAEISYPACLPSAISVGATTDDDRRAEYSNVAYYLSLMAPGGANEGEGTNIYSSTIHGAYVEKAGTSMAAPHVAGAWAVLSGKVARSSSSVDTILDALRSTGKLISDDASGTTTPRIQVDEALSSLSPLRGMVGVASGVTGSWKQISYPQTLTSPVVIAGIPSYADAAPGVTRVSVSSTYFKVKFKEWDYLDGSHSSENVPYLVLEKGRYTLIDGTVIEVGTFSSAAVGSWKSVTFSSALPSGSGSKALFLTVQSNNSSQAVIARSKEFTTTGFKSSLFEQELYMDSTNLNYGHTTETIGYVAVFQPTGSNNGWYIGGTTIESPAIGSLSLTDAWSAWGSVEISLREEQSKDSETTHYNPETVNFLRLNDAVFGQDITYIGSDPFSLRQQDVVPETDEPICWTEETGNCSYAPYNDCETRKCCEAGGVVTCDEWSGL